MTQVRGPVVLRPMTAADVLEVLDIQEPGAILGLANVFPQDAHPFPRDQVAERWWSEIEAPEVDCYVVELDAAVAGFASVRGDEFMHFGIAVEWWGSGLARTAHDAVIDRMLSRGVRRSWLWVFTDNRRGRRFYEKLCWQATGVRTTSSFPPYPELLRYERDLETHSGRDRA